MSKNISSALEAHLQQDATTLATCWKVTLQTSPLEILGFTDHDNDIDFEGVTYEATSGYSRTAIASNATLGVDNTDVEGALDSTRIIEADVRAGVWDFAEIEIFVVNWDDLTQGKMIQRTGTLGEISTGKYAFHAELRGLLQYIQQSIGRIYSPQCDADLGDARCQVDLASLTINGTVTGFDSARVFYDTSIAQASGYFDAGLVTWKTGLNTGLKMEVKTFTQGSPDAQIELHLPMPYAIQVGDTYTMSPGCLKRLEEDCRDKFNNVVNFRGFPHVPGMDQLITGGR